jgi:uncharacterized membrane protein
MRAGVLYHLGLRLARACYVLLFLFLALAWAVTLSTARVSPVKPRKAHPGSSLGAEVVVQLHQGYEPLIVV